MPRRLTPPPVGKREGTAPLFFVIVKKIVKKKEIGAPAAAAAACSRSEPKTEREGRLPLRHLHDLLDPVHVGRHPDEDVGLARVSAAPHGNDDALQYPAVPVLTRQRAAVVSLQTHRNNTPRSLFVSVMTDCHWRRWKHLAVTYLPRPPPPPPPPQHYAHGKCL